MNKRLRDLREDHDKTQSDIGDLLHMSQTGYSQYETGSNDIPTYVLKNLAKFYNTSVDYILGLTNETKPYPPATGGNSMDKFKVNKKNEKTSSISRTIRIKTETYNKLMQLGEEYGISFNKLINQCIDYALENLEE